MNKKQPQLIILAGPNGSGKTTLSEFLKKNHQIEIFLNADTIASGLGNSNKSDIDSGKMLLLKIKQLIKQQESFAFETTLSGRGWINLIKKAKAHNYLVIIYFVFVESENIAIKRVAERVLNGGHDIPRETIIRRFSRSIGNFKNTYQTLADKWFIFNNSKEFAKMIAKSSNENIEVIKPQEYKIFQTL